MGNGHLVCQDCKRDICPTCRVPMDKVEEHEKVCRHRTVSCPYGNCKVKQVSLSKLLDHLNKIDCGFDLAPKAIESSIVVEKRDFEITEDQKAGFVFWKLNTFSFEDVSFGIFVEKHDEKYCFCSVMFSLEKECSKFKIDMAVHEKGSTMEDSKVCFKFAGNPFSIDGEKREFLQLRLALTDKQMEQILKKSNNSFSVSFSIRKTS